MERAKQALMCRVKELQAEQEERVKGAQHAVTQSTRSVTAEITQCKTSHKGHYTAHRRQRASTSSCCLTDTTQTPLGLRNKHSVIEMVLIQYAGSVSWWILAKIGYGSDISGLFCLLVMKNSVFVWVFFFFCCFYTGTCDGTSCLTHLPISTRFVLEQFDTAGHNLLHFMRCSGTSYSERNLFPLTV